MVVAFFEYLRYWEEESSYLTVEGSETEYQIEETISPKEEKLFPNLVGKKLLFTGIIDLRGSEHGNMWAYEHKTTGAWMEQVIHSYRRDPQTIGYFWASQKMAEKQGKTVDGIMVNLHYLKAGKLKDGGYGKLNIKFARDPQVYSKSTVDNWRLSCLYTLDKMVELDKKGFYPMNLDNCYSYNKDCQYTSLCEQAEEDLEKINTVEFVIGEER